MSSTLILNPEGVSIDAIEFNLTGAAPTGDYDFMVGLGSLDLNEEQRMRFVTEVNESGGRTIGTDIDMVPITLTVLIRANSSENRLVAAQELTRAVTNKRGGTLQYRPDGATGRYTYYNYIASEPPRVVDSPSNRWDAGTYEGYYNILMDIELSTQPFATSDPDNPVRLSSLDGATVYNWENSGFQDNTISIGSTELEGNFSSLLRLQVEPWTGQKLGRVIAFNRPDIYDTGCTFDGGTAIYPSIAWSDLGTYFQCDPPESDNGVAQGLEFAESFDFAATGRFAVFGVVRDNATETGVWTHQVKLVSGNISQDGASDYYAESLNGFRFVYAGEFELPMTQLSSLTEEYSESPKLQWYSTRASGTSKLDLFGLFIVWVSDEMGVEGQGTAIDIMCDDDTGVESPERLLIDNLLQQGRIAERSYVIAQDGDFMRALTAAPKGDFIELIPHYDNELTFFHERKGQYTVLSDNFDSYEGSRWFPVADFESDETWTTTSGSGGTDSTYNVEGDQGYYLSISTVQPAGAAHRVVALDLENDGRFTDNDYVVFSMNIQNVSDLNSAGIYFQDEDGDDFQAYIPAASLSEGRNFVAVKKSDFSEIGTPDWSTIVKIGIVVFRNTSAATIIARFDYIRVEKADPDSATEPNATGNQWNFVPNEATWTITEDVTEDTPGATLACLDSSSSPINQKIALLDEDLPDDIQYSARVMIKKSANNAGVIWRAGASTLTAGKQQGYEALVEYGDTLSVYRYASGSIDSTLATETFTGVDYDRWYTLGIIAKGSQQKVFAALSSAIEFDDNAVFDEDYLYVDVEDATYDNGQVGLVSDTTLGRFDNVVVNDIEDIFEKNDRLRIVGDVIFRTITPFT